MVRVAQYRLPLVWLSFVSQSVVANTFVHPSWWDMIVSEHVDNVYHLKACEKKENVPPVDGSYCANNVKTCYFGDQQCNGFDSNDVDYPDTKCICHHDRKWHCKEQSCPDRSGPRVTTSNCPSAEAFRDSDKVCSTEGQQCTFAWTYDTCDDATQSGVSGVQTEECTCDGSHYFCMPSATATPCAF